MSKRKQKQTHYGLALLQPAVRSGAAAQVSRCADHVQAEATSVGGRVLDALAVVLAPFISEVELILFAIFRGLAGSGPHGFNRRNVGPQTPKSSIRPYAGPSPRKLREQHFKLPGKRSGTRVGSVMLQKLSDNIAECLARAADAQVRADEASDSATKRENARMAESWRRLAESYQFVERINDFLDNTKTIGSMPRK